MLSYTATRFSCNATRTPNNTCCLKQHVTTFLKITWTRTVRLQRFSAHLGLLLSMIYLPQVFYQHVF